MNYLSITSEVCLSYIQKRVDSKLLIVNIVCQFLFIIHFYCGLQDTKCYIAYGQCFKCIINES